MAAAMNAASAPAGHPIVPFGVSMNNIIAIVTIHDAQAPKANVNIPHATSNTTPDGTLGTRGAANGVHIFLRRTGPNGGQHCFIFGRERTANMGVTKARDSLDVYIPGSADDIGLRQCSLVPVWEHNSWRLQSSSEQIITINGVPVQVYRARTKDRGNPLPQAVYLRQAEVNHLTINDMRIDIWLMKSVRQVYAQQEFTPSALDPYIQDVTSRPEPWAHERWNLTEEQVSSKTYRAIQRFTGEKETAKIYQTTQHEQQLRDQEFLMFNKQEVDASVVRYLHATEFTNIPAVITDSHVGFVTYASLQDEIRQSHPGTRFEIATMMMRRLFHAVGFMHFHSILHRGVSSESVLIKMVDGKVERVLLVDYSTAHPFPSGGPLPVDEILADGQAVMEVIESCCDIWAFRNGPTLDALGEFMMQKRTTELHDQHMMVKRAVTDFFGRQGISRDSEKGKKLERLLNKTGNDWGSARNAQAQNLRLREVAAVTKTKVNEINEEWHGANPTFTRIGEKQYAILSLGHPYLDSLSNQLHLKRWNTTPQEVCTKYKEFGGDLEHPWQTFEVQKAVLILPLGTGYTELSILTWLATCCEIYQEWRKAIETETERHVQPQGNVVDHAALRALFDALQERGRLPSTMVTMFDLLLGINATPNPIEETYQIWYHVPSRHFNLTQLQRLADPERLQTAITEDQVHCDNFVEVRGDPKIQGCYAALSLLVAFCDVLGLGLPQTPDLTAIPTLDPSDFSQVLPGRIVLARLGMLGYGSMIRSAEQAHYLNPKAPRLFETPGAFLPTNFGDMKVLPQLPYGVRSHERPEHWSKYKTAEEVEALTTIGKRKVIPIKASSKSNGRPSRSEADETAMDLVLDTPTPVQLSSITKLLQERETVRAAAKLHVKRTARAHSPDIGPATSKQARSLRTVNLPTFSDSFMQRIEERAQGPAGKTTQPGLSNPTALLGPGMSFMGHSFVDRNSALLTAPLNDQTNTNHSFTQADESENLEEDWKVVDKLLEQLRDDEDEYMDFTGFEFHQLDEEDEQAGGDIGGGAGAGNSFNTEADVSSFADNMWSAGNNRGKGSMATSLTRQTRQGDMSFTAYGARVPSRLGLQSLSSTTPDINMAPGSTNRPSAAPFRPIHAVPATEPGHRMSSMSSFGYGSTVSTGPGRNPMLSGNLRSNGAIQRHHGSFLNRDPTSRRATTLTGTAQGSFASTDGGSFSNLREQSTTPTRGGPSSGAGIFDRPSPPKIFGDSSPSPNVSAGGLTGLDTHPLSGRFADASDIERPAGPKIFAGKLLMPLTSNRPETSALGTTGNTKSATPPQSTTPARPTGIYGNSPQDTDAQMADTDVESWSGGTQRKRGAKGGSGEKAPAKN